MECLPDNLLGRKYYYPGEAGFEKDISGVWRKLKGSRRRRC